MMNTLPQFVPQDVCLSCDGCCRFKENDSRFRPKLTIDEVYQLRREKPSLADKIFSKTTMDDNGYLKAHDVDGACQCHFFDRNTNKCTIYSHRPFECSLYPFVLTKQGESVSLSVHLSCPYIQKEYDTHKYFQYIEN